MAASMVSQLNDLDRFLRDPAGPVVAALARETGPTSKEQICARHRLLGFRLRIGCLVRWSVSRARLSDCEADVLRRLDRDVFACAAVSALHQDLHDARTMEAMSTVLGTHKRVVHALEDALTAIGRCAD